MFEEQGLDGNTGPPEGFVRNPAWAGSFYPESPSRLRRELDGYLEGSGPRLERTPKALIVPHAGYAYSGPVAGTAFRLLCHASGIQTVVLLGPSHHHEFSGLALSGAAGWRTPLGVVPVDAQRSGKLGGLPQVHGMETPHVNEHCLEVELPFLQSTLQDFQIVPLLVGEASDEEVAQVIESLWGGLETIFLISSDLSHYLDYEAANRLDRNTAEAIEQLRPEGIGPEQACGRLAIRGWLEAARRRNVHGRTLDLRSSGDTSNRRDRVVGYGAFAFLE